MDRAKKARKAVRSGITKLCNEVDVELSSQVPYKKKLEEYWNKFERWQEKLEEHDAKVQEAMLDENATDLEMETAFEEAEEYYNKIRVTKEKIEFAITPQKADPGSATSSGQTVGQGENKNYKLPKIELPKFNGDLKGWLGWWSQFEKIDKDKNLHSADKFQYLIQATEEKSEPREMISVFPPTADNYVAAVDTLKRRYGREGLQLQVYLRELLHLVIANVTKKEKIPLEKLYMKLESHLRALNTLDLSKAEPSMYFYPLVESSLPEETLRTWLRSNTNEGPEAAKKNKLENLMEFIKREVEGEQQINLAQNAFQDQTKHIKPRTGSRNKDEGSTAASLYSGNSNTCVFCDKSNHSSMECFKARKMTLEDRRKKVNNAKACFNCLRRGHATKNCKAPATCFICDKSHPTMLCPSQSEKKDSGNVEGITEQVKSMTVHSIPEPSTSAFSSNKRSRVVLMKTLHVRVKGTTGKEKEVRLLFDEGSQRSYIKTELAEELNCKKVGELRLQNCLFGGELTAVKKRFNHLVHIRGADDKHTKKKELVLVNETIIATSCPIIPKGPWMEELSRADIQVTDTWADSLEVEILIGSDLWGTLMTGRMVKLKSGLIAVESIFGWTVSGKVESPIEDSVATLVTTLTITDDKHLVDLWSLEAIGIKDSAERITQEEHDMEMKKKFQENITRSEDGRYVIQLPWTCDFKILGDNRLVAQKRLEAATKKLQEHGEFKTYDGIFKSWLEEEIIEVVTEKVPVHHFLPHHAVYKPESLTTPVRPVFNASSKTGKGPSLNDCLTKGPNLLELIPSILLRFRAKKIGAIADIRKAFQMIEVQPTDRNMQKFLWWEDVDKKVLQEYRHCRVVFGMNCSPFILAAVLEYHLKNVDEEDRKAAEDFLRSVYVDNSVISFDTAQEYQDFRERTTRILADAKMELRQWESNLDTESTKNQVRITTVLGMKWDKEVDDLYCQLPKKIEDLDALKITKRSVLSLVSQIYDPIGVTCPAIIQPKLQIQDSWALKISWDVEWDEKEAAKFRKWSKEIEDLGQIKISRHVLGERGNQSIQFHCFTDASKSAYAAVVFVRLVQGEQVFVQLMMAKSRLAPVSKNNKRVTIPRLELLGCLIGSVLTNNVKKDLDRESDQTFYWSDSTTALAWIKRDADWGTFVGNRVRDIRKTTRSEQWRHVPGTLNPADLPSRGCSPSQLLESRWWEGPEWLKQPEETWPSIQENLNEEEVTQELRKTPIAVNVTQEIPQLPFQSYLKNVRVAAWIRRYIENCRRPEPLRVKFQWPTVEEMKKGERDLLFQVQQRYLKPGENLKLLKVFKGVDGLLRLQTRLTYKDDWENFKSPILLPRNDPLVEQLIMYVHRMYCHAGTQFLLNKLREKYWILQGRKTVSKVIKNCVTCRRFSIKNFNSDPAPLPQYRIETQAAFQTTGVDLAGPLILKGGKKAWIVIFTCAVYRGVHLDWVESLSTEEFLDCLEKFTLIVGRPSTICSDNGTNFVGAQNLMKKLDWSKLEKELSVKQIKWIFNPPTAAWWGGWWERLIRTLKDLLRKMLGTAKLTLKGLTSCLASVSYVMNNRPLTTMNEDIEDLIPLTPAMFMKDLPVAGLPERDKITSKDLQDCYKKVLDLKKALKERFRKEYLSELIQKSYEKTSPSPEVGQVVLVGSDNKKRCEWPLGRILELIPGRDGKTRVAKVKTRKGILTRPVQRLYPLEVPEPKVMGKPPNVQSDDKKQSEETTEVEIEDAPLQTRSGRVVNKPQRYGEWNK